MTEIHYIHVYQDSNFVSRIPYSLRYRNREVETIFSDNEAIRICEGITNSSLVRQILVRHFKGNLSDDDILDLHTSAMQVVEKYGLIEIERIIDLPPLNFMFPDAQKMFASFDLMRKKKSKPEVRLVSEDGKILLLKFQEKISRRMGRDLAEETKHPSDVVIVRPEAFDGPIICIYRIGIGEFLGSNSSDMESYIRTLRHFSADIRESVYLYGRKFRLCSFCNKPLTDKRSIQAGYGPWCARNASLPWGKGSSNSQKISGKSHGVVTGHELSSGEFVKVVPKNKSSYLSG